MQLGKVSDTSHSGPWVSSRIVFELHRLLLKTNRLDQPSKLAAQTFEELVVDLAVDLGLVAVLELVDEELLDAPGSADSVDKSAVVPILLVAADNAAEVPILAADADNQFELVSH